jgi:hypothetical protein
MNITYDCITNLRQQKDTVPDDRHLPPTYLIPILVDDRWSLNRKLATTKPPQSEMVEARNTSCIAGVWISEPRLSSDATEQIRKSLQSKMFANTQRNEHQ